MKSFQEPPPRSRFQASCADGGGPCSFFTGPQLPSLVLQQLATRLGGAFLRGSASVEMEVVGSERLDERV